MEKNKYFVPNIEDLCEGYEFEYQEYNEETDEFTDKWIDGRFDSRAGLGHDLTHQFREGSVKCKYLTPEQIEAEGWVNKGGHDMECFKRCFFTKGNYMLCLYLKEGNIPVISITVIDLVKPLDWVDKLHEDVYLSFPENYKTIIPCPSINEFRKIVNLMGIK